MKKIILTLLAAMTSMAAGFTYAPNTATTFHSGIHTNGTPIRAGRLAKAQIVVTRPQRGNLFTVYDHININWRFAMGHVAQKCVSIKLYKGNRSIKNLTQRVCRQNFQWKVQNNIADGKYRFKITTVDGKISSYSQIFSIGRADLKVDKNSITIKPQHPDMSDEIALHISISNIGKIKAANSTAALTITQPDGKILSGYNKKPIKVPSINPGSKYIFTPFVDLNMNEYGNYKIHIKLDARNHISESNKDNNSASYTFYVNPVPDLRVCIDTGKRPRIGKNATIRAYALNFGPVASESTDMKIYVHSYNKLTGYHNKIYTFLVPPLKPGSIYSGAHLRYKWKTPGEYDLTAFLGYNQAIGSYYVTAPGGKHGATNKVKCSWGAGSLHPIYKSLMGVR